tara:strand:+ start:82 stop:255 length:174 start_codon:yes stop_codon:yes gene_type:complete
VISYNEGLKEMIHYIFTKIPIQTKFKKETTYEKIAPSYNLKLKNNKIRCKKITQKDE